MERFDVLYPQEYQDRNGEKRTSWWRIGSGFTTQKGDVVLDIPVVPVPNGSGSMRIILRPARDNGGGGEGVKF